MVSLPIDAIARRVHIVPLFGHSQGEPTGQYLLNTTAEPVYAEGAQDRQVFMRCRLTINCDGLLLRSNAAGCIKAVCPVCGLEDLI